MLRTLSKTLMGGAVALSLALTGIATTATPAAANGHSNRNQGAEAAAIFGGLLLLYGLSQAGNTGNRNGIRHSGGTGQPVRPHHNYRIAPSHCYVEGNYHGNRYRGFLARCMHQSVAAPHLLPNNCLRNVYTNHGPRQIYGGRCLADAGWTRG